MQGKEKQFTFLQFQHVMKNFKIHVEKNVTALNDLFQNKILIWCCL